MLACLLPRPRSGPFLRNFPFPLSILFSTGTRRILALPPPEPTGTPLAYRGESLYLILGNRGVGMSKPSDLEREAGNWNRLQSSYISPGYFRAMGIPLLAGRNFNRADLEDTTKPLREMTPSMSQAEAEAVGKKYVLPSVINETMARTFWPGENVLGKIFEHGYTFRIIGVVGDANQGSPRGIAMPEAYYGLPMLLDTPGWPFNVVVQSSGAPESLVGAVRAAVASLDKSLALFHVRTMPQIIVESVTTTRYETVLLLSMAALAVLLAAVGTYGVMSYVVGQRTNEIGIRMALGAGPVEILAMVLRQAFLLVMIGIVVGWGGAAGAAKAIESLLFHVPPFDPITYASVSGMLAVVALGACWIPVCRAMRVDPMVALRDE